MARRSAGAQTTLPQFIQAVQRATAALGGPGALQGQTAPGGQPGAFGPGAGAGGAGGAGGGDLLNQSGYQGYLYRRMARSFLQEAVGRPIQRGIEHGLESVARGGNGFAGFVSGFAGGVAAVPMVGPLSGATSWAHLQERIAGAASADVDAWVRGGNTISKETLNLHVALHAVREREAMKTAQRIQDYAVGAAAVIDRDGYNSAIKQFEKARYENDPHMDSAILDRVRQSENRE